MPIDSQAGMESSNRIARSTEFTRSWICSDAPGVELLRAKYIRHEFGRHTHEGFAVGVIEEGVNRFEYRGTVHSAPAGSVMLINPAEVHTGGGVDSDGWTFSIFFVDFNWLRDLSQRLSGINNFTPFFRSPVVFDGPVFHGLLRAHRICAEAASALERESLLVAAFSTLLERHAENRVAAEPLRRYRKQADILRGFLEEHYSSNVSLAELSAAAQLSPSQTIRVFQHHFGMSPHAYLQQIRVHHARRAIREDRLPLTEVAQQNGFFDQSHLTRNFKKLVGVTPGEYLKCGCP